MLPKDPFVLLSFVNTKLRDEYDNLESLCDDQCVPAEQLLSDLNALGYHYDPTANQFR